MHSPGKPPSSSYCHASLRGTKLSSACRSNRPTARARAGWAGPCELLPRGPCGCLVGEPGCLSLSKHRSGMGRVLEGAASHLSAKRRGLREEGRDRSPHRHGSRPVQLSPSLQPGPGIFSLPSSTGIWVERRHSWAVRPQCPYHMDVVLPLRPQGAL